MLLRTLFVYTKVMESLEYRSKEEQVAAEAFERQQKQPEAAQENNELQFLKTLKNRFQADQERFKGGRQTGEGRYDDQRVNDAGFFELCSYKAGKILDELTQDTTNLRELQGKVDTLLGDRNDDATLYALTSLAMELRRQITEPSREEPVVTVQSIRDQLQHEIDTALGRGELAGLRHDFEGSNSSAREVVKAWHAMQMIEEFGGVGADPDFVLQKVQERLADTGMDDAKLDALVTLDINLRKVGRVSNAEMPESNDAPISSEGGEANESVSPEQATNNYEKHGPTLRALSKFFIGDVYRAFEDVGAYGFDAGYIRNLVSDARAVLETVDPESYREDIFEQLNSMETALNVRNPAEAQSAFVFEFNTLLGILSHDFRISVVQSTENSDLDSRLQTIVDVIETNDPTKANKVAQSLKVGVVMHDWEQRNIRGQVLGRKNIALGREQVVAYKFIS